jgi:hypothetical protein
MGEMGMELSWKHTFDSEDETTYFAFTYPWSTEENDNLLTTLGWEAK